MAARLLHVIAPERSGAHLVRVDPGGEQAPSSRASRDIPAKDATIFWSRIAHSPHVHHERVLPIDGRAARITRSDF